MDNCAQENHGKHKHASSNRMKVKHGVSYIGINYIDINMRSEIMLRKIKFKPDHSAKRTI